MPILATGNHQTRLTVKGVWCGVNVWRNPAKNCDTFDTMWTVEAVQLQGYTIRMQCSMIDTNLLEYSWRKHCENEHFHGLHLSLI